MGDQFRRVGKGSYQLAGADPKTKRKDVTAALKEREASTPEQEPGWHWEGPVPSQEVEDDVGDIDVNNVEVEDVGEDLEEDIVKVNIKKNHKTI